MNLVKHYIKGFLDSRESRRQIFEASRKLCIPMLALGILMTGCINDIQEEPVNNGGSNVGNADGRSYYIALNIEVPTDLTTRDGESVLNGPEFDNECIVEAVDVYFLRAEKEVSEEVIYSKNEVLLKLSTEDEPTESSVTLVGTPNNTANPVSQYKTKILMDDTKLSGLASLAGKKVNILVVCNPSKVSHTLATTASAGTKNAELATMSHTLGSGSLVDFGKDGQVLAMTNFAEFTVSDFENLSGESPDEILVAVKNLFKPQANYERIYDINNPLRVERTVARLDLTVNNNTDDDTHPNTWEWVIQDCGVNVDLYSMTPVNVSKQAYLGRHKAQGSANTAIDQDYFLTIPTPTGSANTIEWIIDVNCEKESTGYLKHNQDASGASVFYNNLTVPEEGAYTFTPVSNSTSLLKDVVNNSVEANRRPAYQESSVYPWFYVSENTLPTATLWTPADEETPADLPKYATGVAFTFQVLDKNHQSLKKNTIENENLWPSAITLNEADTDGKQSITITNTEGEWIEVPESADGCYYITYYGFIGHDDSAATGPQKYSVVRNTVYQMMINEISGLPFPEDPQAQYLSLTINVLAWVKREIHVTF